MYRTALVAVLFVLTGCGGGDDGGGGKSLADLDAVAKAAGCDPVEKDDEPMMFAAETATCTLGTDSVTINWFNNDKARDQYVDMGTGNGAAYVTGDQWAVECQTEDLCAKVAKATGGKAR